MELKYVVLMIIKILISVPAIVLYQSSFTNAAALMGGHLDNKNSSEAYITDYEVYDTDEIANNTTNKTLDDTQETFDQIKDVEGEDEEIPNPSPLVLPGYNLPENIFNKGKPFYLERDPLTGKIDFDSKTSTLKLDDDLYDYIDDEPSSNIYDKSNIDRKDGSLSSHRPSDVNQLTPNFHDFLNLPVKYNSDKYVYPLISSSYANTKIQGNVNKYHNHKNYNVKTTTYKPTRTPTYYTTTYFNPTIVTATTTKTTTTTTSKTPTTTEQIYLTTKKPSTNLMNSGMNHPSFHEEFEYDEPTKKPNEIYLTTENVNNIYLTTKAPTVTTTKKIMSLFEQLFGDYDETVAPTEKTPPLFANLPSNKNTKNKYQSEIKTEKPSYTTPVYSHYPNSHAGPNILTGTNMGIDSNAYEYEDDYGGSEVTHTDNIAVENRPVTEKRPVDSNLITTTTTVSSIHYETQNNTDYNDYESEEKENHTNHTIIESTTIKVTSLPLGENHLTSLNNRQPIIVATQNIREQLNNEKVLPKPFSIEKPTGFQHAPSTSNVHIAPDQDTVSFVVGNHQNVDGGQYVGTALKESPYDSNPFRPLYGQQTPINKDTVSYTIQAFPDSIQNYPEAGGSSITIQPQKNSEAALAIGVPVNSIKQIPGQVVDEKVEINNENIEFPKGTGQKIEFPKGAGQKIVFPDDKETSNLVPPLPPPPLQQPIPPPPLNREVLKLSSQPMYHQLPSDLTPPKEQEVIPPTRKDRPRPPWDPRPGHFHSGKPEYVRPPRPPPEIAYKRIDNLPNILPQFRPNMKPNIGPHYHDNRLNRQPLLDRPSNRPIGFFEKLLPPPPPKNLHNLRKIPPQNLEQKRPIVAEDRIINEAPPKQPSEQLGFYQSPPKVVLANRRIANIEGDVETLQMIQAKQTDKKEILTQTVIPVITQEKIKDNTEKPLYVVYPVNTPPIKLDVIDTNKKESVVIGTRAELPLPPSKINQDFSYEQNPILNPKDRNDSPILKPHSRPPTFPVKSDFPYPLERPDPAAIPEVPSNNGNNLDDTKYEDETNFVSSNQWNGAGEKTESNRLVPNSKNNQISATLKTYTEKPIAVAYTPTESNDNNKYLHTDKYSMPNYASPVIPEIRPGTVDNIEGGSSSGNEFTVSAVMHTFPQLESNKETKKQETIHYNSNHRIDDDVSNTPPQLDFQAPFQASVNIDSKSQGWSVVRNKNKATTDNVSEVTTLPLATTSEFDIENFKPELIGGFKPIYNFPDDYNNKGKESEMSERQER